MRRAWMWVAMAALVCVSGVATAADEKPSAAVTVESKSVALGVGVSWGDGVLSCGGTTRPFSVRGLKLTLAGEGSRSS